ncbi:uncharacterized protein LOC120346803 [Styela clava]
MKVIVASFPKTGTKSMNLALTKLGYKVYDFIENGVYLREEWCTIFNDGWTTEMFRKMYEDIDAVVDLPACYFWEEIHKAFPDAKIILTMRESEDVWYKSILRQLIVGDENYTFRLMQILSPSQRRLLHGTGYGTGLAVFGYKQIFDSKWFGRKMNEQLMKMKYRAHNAYVLQNAPRDKFLLFNMKEGWEPLCKFLGVPVPVEPFPHKNAGGTILNELLTTHPAVIKMKKEFVISSAVLCTMAILILFLARKKDFRSFVSGLFRSALKTIGWYKDRKV